ncbi:CAP domain-containing protein [bacterium]|nr:CAP domain-containing protein [bacterium]
MKITTPLLLAALLAGPALADEASLITKIIALSNQMRKENGVRPVAQLNYLNDAAAGHSIEMIKLKYFSHTSPTVGLERPKSRIEVSGGWDMSIAENIYRSAGVPENELAEDVVDAFMNSPVHRANLLNPKFNSMGIGIARTGKDEWAITQLFSLQTVAIDSYQTNPAGGALDITLKAHVVEGGDQGGILISDKVVNKFSSPTIEGSFQAPTDSKVGVGQKGADGMYNVELEFPAGAKVATPVRTEVAPFSTTGKKVKGS